MAYFHPQDQGNMIFEAQGADSPSMSSDDPATISLTHHTINPKH
jgi:hypothetical protein